MVAGDSSRSDERRDASPLQIASALPTYPDLVVIADVESVDVPLDPAGFPPPPQPAATAATRARPTNGVRTEN
jgi:hypothetical protein